MPHPAPGDPATPDRHAGRTSASSTAPSGDPAASAGLTAALAAQFDTLLAGAPLGIGIFDRDLRHVRVNPVLAEMNGRPAVELIGRTPSQVNGEVGRQAEQLYQQVMDSGESMHDVRLSGEVSARPGQLRHWSLSFHPIRARSTLADFKPANKLAGSEPTPALLREAGDVAGLCVIVADITAETDLSTSLTASTARIEQITETMAVGYLLMDQDWRITSVNTEAVTALGRPREEMVGAVIWELFPATAGTAFEAGYRQAAQTGQPVTFDAYYPPPLDAWYEVRAVPEGAGVALYFLNITERVSAQRAAEAAAEQSQLLARIGTLISSHPDPETAVRGLPQLLAPAVADWAILTMLDTGDRAAAAVRALQPTPHPAGPADSATPTTSPAAPWVEAARVAAVLPHLRDVAAHHGDPMRDALVQTYARTRLVAYLEQAAGSASPVSVQPPFLVRALTTHTPVVIAGRSTEQSTNQAADATSASSASAQVQATLPAGVAAHTLAQLDPRTAVAVAVQARGIPLGVLTLYWDRDDQTPQRHAAGIASPADDLGADPIHTGTARHSGPDRQTLAFIQAVADRLGAAIDEARLVRAQAQIAETLQRSLLTDPPQPDHAHIVARYLPAAHAAQVGGDWYDAFLQDDGASVLVIGDVLGHDMTAAAAMGQVRTLVRAAAVMTGQGPAAIMSTVDAAMRTLAISTTATCVIARLEQDRQQAARAVTALRWSNAGHPPPMLIHPDGAVQVLDRARADLLLGIDAGTDRHEQVVEIDRGATVVLYTDGLVERRGESLEVGLSRLTHALQQASAAEPRDRDGYPQDVDGLCDAVLADMLGDQRPSDDVALIAIRLHRQDEPRPLQAGPRHVPDVVPDEPEVIDSHS